MGGQGRRQDAGKAGRSKKKMGKRKEKEYRMVGTPGRAIDGGAGAMREGQICVPSGVPRKQDSVTGKWDGVTGKRGGVTGKLYEVT